VGKGTGVDFITPTDLPPPRKSTVGEVDHGDEEIEASVAEIERTRAELGNTIGAIQERISPGHIAGQAKDAVVDATVGRAQRAVTHPASTAKGLGSGVFETIRSNPIPSALACAGIGWLYMIRRNSATQPPPRSYRPPSYPPPSSRYPDRYGRSQQSGGVTSQVGGIASSAVGTVQDTASQAVSQVQDVASRAMGQAQETAGQVTSQVQDTAGQWANQAQWQVQHAAGSFQDMMRRSPLAVGLGALALGVAAGLAIPETEIEDKLLGETRDGVMDQAQQTIQDTAQKAQSVVQQAVGAAKDAATEAAGKQGLTPDSVEATATTPTL